jgi:peptidoglycan-associated lipoprotein
MTKKTNLKVLVAGACMICIFAARANSQAPAEQAKVSTDVAVAYNLTMANVVGGYGFSMQGASVQVHAQFFRGWGVVADVAGLHATRLTHSTAGLDLVTASFGPRYTWVPAHHRLSLFAHVLAGEAYGMNSIFPSAGGVSSSANSFALEMGGGMNLPLSRHINVRAFEVDWLRTELPNSTTNIQNNLRVGAGFVFRSR